MKIRWTAEARSDLARLYEFLAPVDRQAAARVIRTLRLAPSRLQDHPRLGARLQQFAPREVRRLVVGDYDLRYEVRPRMIVVLNLWHNREDR
jgi:plasmid stabilization system protein ParE